jgi:hypothetical protein
VAALEEVVGQVPEAVGHVLDDLIPASLKLSGVDWILAVTQDIVELALQQDW